MSIFYPLYPPSLPGFRTFKLTQYSAVGEDVSPFTGQAQEQLWQFQGWELECALPPMMRASTLAGQWLAFLGALQGKFGSFLIGDPSGINPQGIPLFGVGFTAPLVNGILFVITTIARASGIVTATIPANASTVLTFSNGSNILVQNVSTDASYDGPSFAVIAITPIHVGGTLIAYQVQWLQPGPDSSSSGGQLGLAGGVPAGVNSLPTRGWAPGTAGLLLRGDYIQVGGGTTQRLYQVLTDVNSTDTGLATLDIFPCLRESLLDGTLIVLGGAAGCFRLADNRRTWDVNQDRTVAISFKAREAI